MPVRSGVGISAISRKIGESARILVVGTAYLGQAVPLDLPEDLVQHDCLVHSSANGRNLWRLTDGERHAEVRVRGRFAANSVFALLKAARNDLGIALLPTQAVQVDLARGSLVRVLPRYHTASEGLYSIYPSHRQRLRAVQAFVELMIEWTHAIQQAQAATAQLGKHTTSD
jgi:DNA-binding transcriptional LysR family regulator